MASCMIEKGFYHYLFGLLCLNFVLLQPLALAANPATEATAARATSTVVDEVAVDTGSVLEVSQARSASGAGAPSQAVTVAKDTAADVNKDIDAALDKESSIVDGLANDFANGEIAEYLPSDVVQTLQKEIFGISLWQFICSFLLLLLTLLLRNFIVKVVFDYISKFVKRTRFEFDEKLLEALHKPLSVFLLCFGVFVSLMVLSMSHGLRNFIENIYRGLVMVLIFWGLLRVVDVLVDVMVSRNAERYNSLHGFVPLIRKTLKVFIGLVGAIMVIDNMGFNVGGILATLGIGGAALAFASKDTVANGFGTLMIMLDRPFKVGDWIMVGDKVDGDVEEIGLRSTKVRTWPKTILSIPNGVLANEYINNWSRMPKRRVKQVINIAHGATANDMEGLVEDIRAVLRADVGVEQEFILVNFTDITAESLEILVYYFTVSIKWLEHMDVRQRVNLKMMQAVEERGLQIAFLEQSLELEYNTDVEQGEKMPWEERWDAETKANPKGTYTRRSKKSSSNGLIENNGKPELPGDFGPSSPL